MEAATAPSRARLGASWLEGIADPVRLQILRQLSRVEDATAAELAVENPASYRTLRRHLEALEACGVIETRPGISDGASGGRPATRFSLTSETRDSVRLVLNDHC